MRCNEIHRVWRGAGCLLEGGRSSLLGGLGRAHGAGRGVDLQLVLGRPGSDDIDLLVPSQVQVEAQCFVDRSHQGRRDSADCRADPLNGDRADLLSLGLGVHPQSCLVSWQQHLEREYPLHVAGDGHHGHHSATKSLGHGVGPVITDEDGGATPVGLTTADGIQINEKDLTAQHR